MSEAVFNDLKRAKRQNYELIYAEARAWRPTTATWWGRCSRTCYARLLGRPSCAATRPRRSSVTTPRQPRREAAPRVHNAEDYLAGEPNQIVVDYLASMTDRYFTSLFAHLFPESPLRTVTRGYCADLG